MKIKLSRPSAFHGPRLKGELMVAYAAPRLRRAVLMTLENPECPVKARDIRVGASRKFGCSSVRVRYERFGRERFLASARNDNKLIDLSSRTK
jgi:hypothetical protein